MTDYNYRDDLQKLAATIKSLQDQITALQAQGAYVPMVDTDPNAQYGNIWLFNDNRIRIRKRDGTIREIVTTAPGSSTTGTGLPAAPAQPTTQQNRWLATWSQTYMQSGGQRSESSLHVGYADSYNGRQTSLIGFNSGSIAAGLSGAAINRVEIYLYCTHCYWNAGSTVFIGTHMNGSAPGTLSNVNRIGVSQTHVQGSDQGGNQGWHDISTNIGAWLRDGTATGIVLSAPTSNSSYYSVYGGFGSGIPAPQLRLTYTK